MEYTIHKTNDFGMMTATMLPLKTWGKWRKKFIPGKSSTQSLNRSWFEPGNKISYSKIWKQANIIKLTHITNMGQILKKRRTAWIDHPMVVFVHLFVLNLQLRFD